jgi:DNA polymerase
MSAAPAAPDDELRLLALLDWYVSTGVDLAVDESPHDRFAESAVAAAPRPSPPAAPVARAAAPSPRSAASRPGGGPVFTEEAARAAREAAEGAGDLDALRERLAAFEGCALRATAGHFLLSAGTPGAPLMALDLGPSEEEERVGEAFVGAEARLLDNMLKAIGRDRSSAYLVYAAPWRPPGGPRELNAGEIAALRPFLLRHVELAAPKVLLVLGNYACRAALGATDVARLGGQWFDYEAGAARPRALLLPSLASLLTTPILKRRAWRDLRMVAKALGGE